MPKTTTKTPDDDRCPNCGYCPHCGQSAKPRVVPAPYPQPYPVPYRRPVFWEEGVQPQIQPYRVWCGQTTSLEGSRELRSVSVSYSTPSTSYTYELEC